VCVCVCVCVCNRHSLLGPGMDGGWGNRVSVFIRETCERRELLRERRRALFADRNIPGNACNRPVGRKSIQRRSVDGQSV
jgi:hypothetical protein